MTIRLLLDEHVPGEVARRLRDRGLDAVSVLEWRSGQLSGKSDEEMLQAAHLEQRTLLTFDVHSIPRLLVELAEAGVEHSGVILVSTKTFQPAAVAVLVEALVRLLAPYRERSLQNVVLFLTRAE